MGKQAQVVNIKLCSHYNRPGFFYGAKVDLLLICNFSAIDFNATESWLWNYAIKLVCSNSNNLFALIWLYFYIEQIILVSSQTNQWLE